MGTSVPQTPSDSLPLGQIPSYATAVEFGGPLNLAALCGRIARIVPKAGSATYARFMIPAFILPSRKIDYHLCYLC